jgi:hypothetical protein
MEPLDSTTIGITIATITVTATMHKAPLEIIKQLKRIFDG